jgi:hypothetical protein
VTSQQSLRHFSLLPTTYNNFADKNAETLKLLRLLRLDPKLEWNFVAKVAAAACPARCVHQLWSRRWSPVAKSLPFPSVSSALPIGTVSSPGGEDQDEGVRSLRSKEPLFPMRDSRRGDVFFRSADSPVRPSFQKHTEHTKNTVRHTGNTVKTQSRHSPKHNGNTIKPQQNTINTIKTHSFFSEDPNVNPRSACYAYPFEKNIAVRDLLLGRSGSELRTLRDLRGDQKSPHFRLGPATRSTAISRILQLFRPYWGFGWVDCGATRAMKPRYDFLVWICW